MSWKQKVGNRLGCGYIPHKDEIFFTYNGEECKPTVKIEGEHPFYGVIGLKSPNDTVKWITDSSSFTYKLEGKI